MDCFRAKYILSALFLCEFIQQMNQDILKVTLYVLQCLKIKNTHGAQIRLRTTKHIIVNVVRISDVGFWIIIDGFTIQFTVV